MHRTSLDAMYIYSKPHAPRTGEAGDAERDSAQQEQQHTSSPGPTRAHPPQLSPTPAPAPAPPPGPLPSSSASPGSKPAPADPVSQSRRCSFPVNFPFPPLFQPNTSSTSLAPSTAEFKPIPLDNTTAAHRTSALQKLNSAYPSEVRRHRYAKSAGAQSSTYSQPVLVRTYPGPPPSQASNNTRNSRYRPSSSSRGGSRRVPLPPSSRQSATNLTGRPIQPALSGIGTSNSGNGHATDENGGRVVDLNMPRHKPKKNSGKLPLPLPLQLPLPWQWQSTYHDEAKLPPLEAFSFKSIMADMNTRGGEDSIGADLDRIAEICARSRYSLSNQYEVHVAPHGSGASFVTASSSGNRRRGHNRSHTVGGPTLQAFNSDDDDSAAARSHRKRRSGGRRKSVAYGTLETIMSSSRSSEEDKTKKKPAAEIATEVRGRAAKKNWDSSTGSGSKSGSTAIESKSHGRSATGSGFARQDANSTLARKKSASFATAILDSGRSTGRNEAATAFLVGEPALPQTSNTNLGVRTAPDAGSSDCSSQESRPPSPNQRVEVRLADDLPHQGEDKAFPSEGSRAGWSSWIPWRSSQTKSETEGSSNTRDTPSHAEGSLRQLLKSVDVTSDKGKAIDRGG